MIKYVRPQTVRKTCSEPRILIRKQRSVETINAFTHVHPGVAAQNIADEAIDMFFQQLSSEARTVKLIGP